jgi:tRNA(Ile)-lysidine synthase
MPTRPLWTPLHSKLHQTLRHRKLLPPQQLVLIAVSGGQDSLCLSKLLLDLQPKWGWQLAIAHCDHRWQLDTGLAAHVEQLAQRWAVPFYLATATEVTETEAAARQWRYQALSAIASSHGYLVIVTGHTKSDRAETLLYNLIRGAGADGLQALTWQRQLAPRVQLVRPLLEVSRQETWQFCQELQLPIWEDAYNQNLKYARNRIRNELLPYLQTHFNPQVETALAQTGELLRADVEYLEQEAQVLREQAMPPNAQPGQINRRVLQGAPLALKRRAIRQFLQDTQTAAPTYEQIEAVTALIAAPNRSQTSSFPGRITVIVEGDWLTVRSGQ